MEFDREQRAIMYRKRALGPKTIVRKIDDAFCLPQGLPGEPVTEVVAKSLQRKKVGSMAFDGGGLSLNLAKLQYSRGTGLAALRPGQRRQTSRLFARTS